jgi:flagellar basal body rod protein FlgB
MTESGDSILNQIETLLAEVDKNDFIIPNQIAEVDPDYEAYKLKFNELLFNKYERSSTSKIIFQAKYDYDFGK